MMMQVRNKWLLVASVILLILGVGMLWRLESTRSPVAQPGSIPTEIPQYEELVRDLVRPWAIAFLPDTSFLITERAGNIRKVSPNFFLDPNPALTIDEVKEEGEGGLLGITIHPDFSTNQQVYVYYTYQTSGNQALNRVVRYRYDGTLFADRRVIVDQIPGAVNHNGGRIKFGPDGFLYITTGDAQEPSLAQDTSSLAGKILRVTADGQMAAGNPFGNLVYSYGHRNPQGLAWDTSGQLWATEHGQSSTDELNKVVAGQNYGWPTIRGDQQANDMRNPVLHSGENNTWAPSGMAIQDGNIYFAGLRGSAVFQTTIGANPQLKQLLKDRFGRVRDVVVGPDKLLYVLSHNRDGRGLPRAGDDKVFRVNPKKIQ
jgi:glucose/arabinose dehydrogenase